MNPILLICSWLLFSPLGYMACRWASDALGARWTRLDRLYAIVGSVCYGPLMPLMAVLLVLLQRLHMSSWSDKDARW